MHPRGVWQRSCVTRALVAFFVGSLIRQAAMVALTGPRWRRRPSFKPSSPAEGRSPQLLQLAQSSHINTDQFRLSCKAEALVETEDARQAGLLVLDGGACSC